MFRDYGGVVWIIWIIRRFSTLHPLGMVKHKLTSSLMAGIVYECLPIWA